MTLKIQTFFYNLNSIILLTSLKIYNTIHFCVPWLCCQFVLKRHQLKTLTVFWHLCLHCRSLHKLTWQSPGHYSENDFYNYQHCVHVTLRLSWGPAGHPIDWACCKDFHPWIWHPSVLWHCPLDDRMDILRQKYTKILLWRLLGTWPSLSHGKTDWLKENGKLNLEAVCKCCEYVCCYDFSYARHHQ